LDSFFLWASWLFPYSQLAFIGGSLAVPMNIIITYAIWLSWRRGERVLLFLMIGWGVYTLCISLYVVTAMMGNGWFFAQHPWAAVSLILQSLFFVLALFHRYSLW
jgi:hypothetical protein